MEIIQPFGERVLIRVTTPVKETESGLIVRPVDKDSSNTGIVEAVGEGTMLKDGTVKPLSIAVGDTVLFNRGTGTKIYEGEEVYIILHSKDILGKLIKEDK